MRVVSGYAQDPSELLGRYRVYAGLSKRGLARLAGVPEATVREAERGSVPIALTQHRLAAALSQALGRPIDRFELWPLVKRQGAA